MTSKRIALAAAALALTAGLAVGSAQPPPPDAGDWAGLEVPAFFAAGEGAGGFAGPGGSSPRRGRAALAAFRGPGRPGGHRVMDPRRLADYLQLTDAQRASARELFEAQRGKVRPLFENQRALRGDLEAMLDDANATDAAIGQLVKQLRTNRQALKTAREDLRGQLAGLLDEGQQAKLEQLRSVMEGLRESGRRHARQRG